MFDLVIRGGTIVDGCGGEPFPGDVAMNGRCITAVGMLRAARPGRLIGGPQAYLRSRMNPSITPASSFSRPV